MMVIRGTHTRPELSVDQALKNLENAQRVLVEATEVLQKAKSSCEDIHLLDKETDSQHVSGDVAHGRLLEIIDTLETRVKKLEQHEYVSLQKSQLASEELRKVFIQLGCGGMAGAVARSVVAPIDRVKILMQTQFLSHGGQNKYKSIVGTWQTIIKEQGYTKLWRGNVTNVVRVAPYAALQFASYDYFKEAIQGGVQRLQGGDEPVPFTISQRLLAGACAGTVATTFTHPLDLIRLRLNTEPELRGAFHALNSILSEGGARSLFKGYLPTVMSLAPFIGINFAVFDTLKSRFLPEGKNSSNKLAVLGLGASAGIIAQSVCFPLDTVRRRMQMKGTNYSSTLNCFATIAKVEGPRGFYNGMLPNVIKVVPNNAIRFLVFDMLKTRFIPQKKSTR